MTIHVKVKPKQYRDKAHIEWCHHARKSREQYSKGWQKYRTFEMAEDNRGRLDLCNRCCRELMKRYRG